jgi:peptide/nickel transport system substrate-binding protein
MPCSTAQAGKRQRRRARKNGKKLRFVHQTSINATRQKTQAILKQACQKAGIELELKSVTGSVYFSSDVANPDTYGKFYADMQMYTTTMTQPDPGVSWTSTPPRRCQQGQQMAGPQHRALPQPRVRQDATAADGVRTRPRQARGLFIAMNDLLSPRHHHRAL